MRRYILFFVLCLVFFIMPLQVFIIGNDLGIGIQGAAYRFQVTQYGTFFFPFTREIVFVLNGTLTGKTALSVLLWVAGTVLLACTTYYSFSHVNDAESNFHRQIAQALIIVCLIYLGSSVAQYGFLFHGPAGTTLPVGILLILAWTGIIWYYRVTIRRYLVSI